MLPLSQLNLAFHFVFGSPPFGCVYMRSVYIGSIWIGSTLARVHLNCVGFTRSQYHPGTVQFQSGSLSQVYPFGTGQENRSRADLLGPVT